MKPPEALWPLTIVLLSVELRGKQHTFKDLEKKDLLARIDEGRRQLDAGEYTEYDDETLRTLFDELGQRAREAGQSSRDAK